jgi:hypothetical protein
MSNPTGADDTPKKRPRSTTPTNISGNKDEISSKKQKQKKKNQTDINDDYADEISSASSSALLPLLLSSLYRMTNGLPRRELNLIVSEAQACEDALEQELKLLRGALRIEKQKREKAKATTNDVATTSATDNTLSDKGVTDKNAEKNEKVAEQSSPASTSTTAITTATKSVTDDSNSSSNDNESPTTYTIMTPTEVAAVDTMIDSEITPTDAHWTLSALLGRLRHELTTPLPPGSQLPAYREKAGLQQLVNSVGLSYSSSSSSSSSSKKKRTMSIATASPAAVPAAEVTISTTATITDSTAADTSSTTENNTDGKMNGRSTPNINNNDDNTSNTLELSQYKRLTVLLEHPEFVREHDNTDKLMAIWKKLSTHRSTLVFRRPVNPKEAPGYSDRIRFPIDLSLIRKLIVSKNIKNYHGILQRVHLIAHNCVKYNGRESDYALVTREFESVATEYIFTAVTSPVPVPSPLVVPMPPPLVAPTTTTTTTASGSTDRTEG